MVDRANAGVYARSRRGFSLIEVLGAVSILGITYVMLATLAIQGMQITGESQRRLHASIIADELLMEYELAAALGEEIAVEEDEKDQDGFTIRWQVFDMSETEPIQGAEGENLDLFSFLAEEANGPHAEFRPGNFLLGYLRELHIEVVWTEGVNEITVSRTGYVFDQGAFMDRGDVEDEEP